MCSFLKIEEILRRINMVFVCYPRCTTCQKARKWLVENNLEFTERNIKEENPTLEELKEWHKKSGLPLKKFFNTSGMKYRELNLKDRLTEMSDEEQFELLSSDGMIVKRPILVGDDFVLVGFKESEWKASLGI
jgi:arsenate reductase